MKSKLSIILLIILLASCSTFDKNLKNSYPLNSNNLTNLNGKFSIINQNNDSIIKRHNLLFSNNLISELDRKLLKDTIKIDNINNYKVELTVINKKKIKLSYIKNDKITRERILRAKLKKDGYLYLKNNNVKPLLIPHIAGAIDIKKSRLSVDENNNLIFDAVHYRSGAVLLIVFLDWRTWKYRNEYQKIE